MLILLLALQIPDNARLYQADMIRSARAVFGISAPVATLAAQIHQESGWRPEATSFVGAEGLAQFMPATASDMARIFPNLCRPANPRDPRWAFGCRDRYMESLLRFSKRPVPDNAGFRAPVNECSEWAFGLRSYNGGAGWMRRDRERASLMGLNPNDWKQVRNVNAGRRESAHRENREYPERIYRLSLRYEEWGASVQCP